MKFRSFLLVAITTAAAVVPAQAHHSQSMYDVDVWKTIDGTVKQVRWTFPHTWLYIEVKDAEGKVKLWSAEAGNPNSVQDAGVTKEDLKVGDQVRARCHPARSGAASCVLGFVTPMHGDVSRGHGVEKAWN
jgi:hypothetical protein